MQLAVTMEEQYIKLQKHTTKYILKHTVKHIFSPSPPLSYPPGQHMNGHSLTNPSRLALSLTHILSPLSPLLLFPSHTLSGQHMNGDEAMAMGAAFRAANLSTAFRVRKVGHTNTPCHTNTRPSITRPVLLTTYHSFSLIPPPPPTTPTYPLLPGRTTRSLHLRSVLLTPPTPHPPHSLLPIHPPYHSYLPPITRSDCKTSPPSECPYVWRICP